MTEQMETLMNSIAMNRVPATWEKYGFATTRALASWLENLRHRLDQLNIWKEDPVKEKGKL
jgi:dynein heavy chain